MSVSPPLQTTPLPDDPGGKGEPEPRRREAVRLGADIRAARVFQAPLDEAFVKRVRDVVRALMASPKIRQRAAGARLGIQLMDYNLSLLEKADRMDRLDAGAPTERVEHQGGPEIDLMALAAKDPALMDVLVQAVKRVGCPAPTPDGGDGSS